MIKLKNEQDIEELKKSGRILGRLLRVLKKASQSGVKLSYLDELARKILKEAGAESAFLGYQPPGQKKSFPAAICTSINNQIVHGLPSAYLLKPGDLLKIDAGINFHGYITDAALTIGIEPISKISRKLIKTTALALKKALSQCYPDKRIGDIGWAIETTVEKTKFKVVKGLTGHGVGFQLHEDPIVYNFGRPGTGLQLKKGMVLAIEPMVSLGSADIKELEDGSIVTRDGSLAAHFEKTVAITAHGPEILTEF